MCKGFYGNWYWGKISGIAQVWIKGWEGTIVILCHGGQQTGKKTEEEALSTRPSHHSLQALYECYVYWIFSGLK